MRFVPWGDRFALDRLWPRRRTPERQQPGDAERTERLYWSVLRDVHDLIEPPPPSERRPRQRRRRRVP